MSQDESAATFVRAIAETSPAMLWMGNAQGRCVFLNTALRTFWGVNPQRLEDFDWTSTIHPDDVGMLTGPFAEAMATRTPFSVEARYKRADGVYRTMRTQANPRFADTGEFLGMTGVNSDISDQLAAEDHNRLLLGELNHRTKNLMTVVQVLARQTSREEPPERFLDTLDQRLSSLAASNDLLVTHNWNGVLLADLVGAQLAFLPEQTASRVSISGPTRRLSSSEAQTLGMALHELSTNSLKYGALSTADGHVRLEWRNLEDDGWTMEWQEHGDTVTPPARKGFGHRVMVDMVAAALNAAVNLEIPPTGLHWQMTVQATDERAS